jgi:hypothetical protein
MSELFEDPPPISFTKGTARLQFSGNHFSDPTRPPNRYRLTISSDSQISKGVHVPGATVTLFNDDVDALRDYLRREIEDPVDEEPGNR